MPAPPRILMDGRPLLDPTSGGVFEYAQQILDRLRRSASLSIETWADRFTGSFPKEIDRATRWPNKILHAGVRAFGRPRLDRLAGVKPDLFWAPNPHFLSLSAGLPFALTIHDVSYERYPEFFSIKQRLWHAAVDPRHLARRAARVLTVSNHAKSELVALYGIDPAKIEVTPEGCDDAYFETPSITPADLRRALKLPDRFILHIGALEPRKNHRSLIEAFELLAAMPSYRDLGLVLAGPSGWNNADVCAAIANSPFRGRIIRLGFVDTETKRALYRAASVFAFPSYYEGFGLPPLEAMASGTPVVASFAASLGGLIAAAGVLIDPYRPGELADGIASVLESPAFAAELARRGTARARQFSWEACAKKTESALLRALD